MKTNPIFKLTQDELRDSLELSKSLNETIQEAEKKMAEIVASRREDLVTAWVAETGLLPSESVICMGYQGNILRIFVESKTDNDKRVRVAAHQE